MVRILFIFLFYSINSFSQITITNPPTSDNYDLTECAVNIRNGDNVYRRKLDAFESVIMLQSETALTVGIFRGTATIIHGLKAQEELDNFISPVLIIEKCKRGSVVNVSARVEYKTDNSCIINIINQQ